MSNLWPDDIEKEYKKKSPVLILKEVASALGRKTKNILLGEVQTSDPEFRDMEFNYKFNILVPFLNDYRFLLFEIEHPLDLYPLIIIPDKSILMELTKESQNIKIIKHRKDFYEYPVVLVESEEEFLTALEAITKSKRTREIIQLLKSQIQ